MTKLTDLVDELEAEIAQLRQDKTELLEVLIGKPFGLNKERFPEKHGYCFCGVAVDNPNYGGEHGPCCLKARAALAKHGKES